ncbi:MAG: HK97 family phage prohead protease [Prolixibacteraceae bacterium]|nr:HK97 family phage prohead protease [Prolixibacteraceae bacterium]
MERLVLDFTASDESLNRYGYWVRTEGIQTANYERNPVFLLQHNENSLSIGRVCELKKEMGRLTIKVEFDKDDPEAVKIYNKYKNKYMNAVSISFGNIVFTEAEDYIKQGQSRPTVFECELLEISAVSVPGNRNALKLFDETGTEMKLSFLTNNTAMETKKTDATNTDAIEKLKAEIESLKVENEKLKAGATGQNADNKNTDTESTADNTSEMKAELLKIKTLNAETLVDTHINRGALDKGERDFFVKAALSDYMATKTVLEKRKAPDALTKFVTGLGADSSKSETPDLSKMSYGERISYQLAQKHKPENK